MTEIIVDVSIRHCFEDALNHFVSCQHVFTCPKADKNFWQPLVFTTFPYNTDQIIFVWTTSSCSIGTAHNLTVWKAKGWYCQLRQPLLGSGLTNLASPFSAILSKAGTGQMWARLFFYACLLLLSTRLYITWKERRVDNSINKNYYRY